MKIFALILSIVISALAVMPCSDNITCDNKETTAQHDDSGSSPLAHDHSEDEGDLCTPFCNCACCGCMGFIVTVPSIHLINIKEIIPSVTFTYEGSFVSSYFYSFWQPPKISLS